MLTDNQKSIILRFVNGEKKLFTKVNLMIEGLDEKDDCQFADYLREYNKDNPNLVKLFELKQQIRSM